MSSILKTIIPAFVAIAVATPVVAAQTRVVPANRASVISFFYGYADDNCYTSGKQKMNVIHAPSHGSITGLWKSYKMGDKGPKNCRGMPIHGTLVVYRPNPGYHGPDTVSFSFTTPEMSGYIFRGTPRITVNITVK